MHMPCNTECGCTLVTWTSWKWSKLIKRFPVFIWETTLRPHTTSLSLTACGCVSIFRSIRHLKRKIKSIMKNRLNAAAFVVQHNEFIVILLARDINNLYYLSWWWEPQCTSDKDKPRLKIQTIKESILAQFASMLFFFRLRIN